jgi:ABC-type glycerol-3-phosphate transport system permease component
MKKKKGLASITNQPQKSMLESDDISWLLKAKIKRKSKKTKRLSRSVGGDIALFMVLLAFGAFSAYPLIFTICNSLKPYDEMFIFPPKLFPQNLTFDNFIDLFNLVGNSQVPITRFLFNTIFITIVGTVGHVILASMCAYPLAKYNFPGKTIIFTLIVYSLMFSGAVLGIPNYMIVSKLGLLDSAWAIIIPAFASS